MDENKLREIIREELEIILQEHNLLDYGSVKELIEIELKNNIVTEEEIREIARSEFRDMNCND